MPAKDTFTYDRRLTPISGDIKSGYAVNPDYSTLPSNNATNGYLEDAQGKQRVALYVQDVSTNISIGGSTAQSVARRAWYPRSLIQPSYTVSCQCRSQKEAAYIAEFIRFEQVRTLSGNDATGDEFLSELIIAANYHGHNAMGDKHSKNVRVNTPDRNDNGKDRVSPAANGYTKGWHEPIWVRGYVKSIERNATAGVNAPEVEFEFIVVRQMNKTAHPFPPDLQPKPAVLPRWHDVFVAGNADGFVTEAEVNSMTVRKPAKKPKPTNNTDSPNGGSGLTPHDIGQDAGTVVSILNLLSGG